MSKAFSFASWNVKHFHGKPERLERVIGLLTKQKPDIFGIYEVTGKHVFEHLMQKMPDHAFYITERQDKAHQEILVGVRRSIQSFVTQRDEFRSKVPSLRPGLMVTLRIGNFDYVILLLHLKSFSDPRSWGLRDDMFAHIARLKRKLDKTAQNPPANMLCLGDLNTMGLNAPYNNLSDLDGTQEIESISRRLVRAGLKRLSKTHDASWWNGQDNWQPSNLDHVFASKNLVFKTFNDKEIKVIGWPEKNTKKTKQQWINQYSDHALLYGEVLKST